MRGHLAVIVALLVSVSPAAAQSKYAPEPANPYKNLFQPKTIEQAARSQQRADNTAKPRVVCGMTLIPADPGIDPKIYVAPRNDATHDTMRVIPPAICK